MTRIALAITLSVLAAGPAAGSIVSVESASTQPIQRIVRVNGTVTSPQDAMLSPSVGGLVQEIAVDAGDRVETGDLLVQLDPELSELSLEQARAAESEARSALQDARRRLAEAEEVGSERGIPETEIRSRRAEVSMDEAALEAASAAVRERAAVVRRHTITAPFTGAISQRLTAVGEWVNPGDQLVELVATEGLRFDFRVPQEHFSAITESTTVRVSLDAYPGREFDARVVAVVPVKDPTARTFLLRAVSDDAELPTVTPGMSARAALAFDTGRSAVTVPRDALLRYPDGRTTVWVLGGEEGRRVVNERPVAIGLEFDGSVEIRSGIEDGARVVTRGNEVLRDGQTVTLR